MSVLAREDESENEVRKEDQENINKFARLNARLNDVRSEQAALKKELERLDDASTEIMMADGGDDEPVWLWLGEAFFETSETSATEHCEAMVEQLQSKVDEFQQEEKQITDEQARLKSILYGRFGNSINLEA